MPAALPTLLLLLGGCPSSPPAWLAGGALTLAEDQEATGDLPGATDVGATVSLPPAHGRAWIAADTLHYLPDADWSGGDTVTLRADGADVRWTVTVTPVDDPPTAADLQLTTPFATALAFDLPAADVDGDALTAALVTGPAHGTVTLTGLTALYTPDPTWSGPDALTWQVDDGHSTVPATVSLTVAAPLLTTDPLALTTAEDTPVTGTLTAQVDAEGGAVRWIVWRPPALGEASLDGATLTYSPAADATGADSFEVLAIDERGDPSLPALVTVAITPAPDAPVAADQAVTTDEDVAVDIPLAATDADGDALTATITAPPEWGDVTVHGLTARYTPPPEVSGTVTFRWTATDGRSTTAEGTVTVDVRAVNDLPVGAATEVEGDEDTTLAFVLAATDVEDDASGAALTYSVVTDPAHGTWTLDGTTGTYTPDPDWNGTDTLEWVATDADGAASPPVAVTLIVDPVNDAPVPDALTLTCDENGGPASLALTATDVDGDALTYTLVTRPDRGRASVSKSILSYTPDPDFDGADEAEWGVDDGTGVVTAALPITVADTNGSPRVEDSELTLDEDTTASVALPTSDPDGGALTVTVVVAPSHGTATVSGTTLTYTPDADYAGSDALRWRAEDADGYAAYATLSIRVAGVNDAPTLADASATTDEDTPVAFTAPATDPDAADTLTYTATRAPAHGTVAADGRGLTYTPNPEWSGRDTFEVTVDDGTVSAGPATFTVDVAAVHDSPTLYTTRLQVGYGEDADFEPSVHAPDSRSVTVSVATAPRYGTVTDTGDGWLRYTPPEGWYGRDRFTLLPSDEASSGEPAEVQVAVYPPALFGRPATPQLGVNLVLYWNIGEEDSAPADAEPYLPENVIDTLLSLGARSQRQLTEHDLTWQNQEPEEGTWLDPGLNEAVTDAWIEPLPTLFDFTYASGSSPFCTDPADFQKTLGPEGEAYLDHVAAAFGAQATQFELGNEMWHWVAADPPVEDPSNLPDCYPTDGYTPEEQGVFLEQAADYFSAAVPDAAIVLPAIGSASPVSEEWLRGVVAGTSDTDWFDVVTWHAYTPWQETDAASTEIDALLAELGLEDKLFSMTETGSSWDVNYDYRTDYPNSTDTQCADVWRLPLLGWAAGAANVGWHTLTPLTDHAPTDEGTFHGYELIAWDGTWYPAAYSFQLLTRELLPFRSVEQFPAEGRWWFRVVRTDLGVRWVGWGDGRVEVPEGVSAMTSVVPDASGNFTWTRVRAGEVVELSDIPIVLH